MSEPQRDPQTQFQIGDKVLYVPEGVETEIDGYLWIQSVGGLPKIGAFKLRCGIEVPAESIVKR